MSRLAVCAHSKTVYGCDGCTNRLKAQASRWLAERNKALDLVADLEAEVRKTLAEEAPNCERCGASLSTWMGNCPDWHAHFVYDQTEGDSA